MDRKVILECESQLFDYFISREKVVSECVEFMSLLYACVQRRRDLDAATTPESKALARSMIQDARKELTRIMTMWSMPVSMRMVVTKLIAVSV